MQNFIIIQQVFLRGYLFLWEVIATKIQQRSSFIMHMNPYIYISITYRYMQTCSTFIVEMILVAAEATFKKVWILNEEDVTII